MPGTVRSHTQSSPGDRGVRHRLIGLQRQPQKADGNRQSVGRVASRGGTTSAERRMQGLAYGHRRVRRSVRGHSGHDPGSARSSRPQSRKAFGRIACPRSHRPRVRPAMRGSAPRPPAEALPAPTNFSPGLAFCSTQALTIPAINASAHATEVTTTMRRLARRREKKEERHGSGICSTSLNMKADTESSLTCIKWATGEALPNRLIAFTFTCV